jgi:hypothetical protein
MKIVSSYWQCSCAAPTGHCWCTLILRTHSQLLHTIHHWTG